MRLRAAIQFKREQPRQSRWTFAFLAGPDEGGWGGGGRRTQAAPAHPAAAGRRRACGHTHGRASARDPYPRAAALLRYLYSTAVGTLRAA
eukprot:SAG31_NODE_9467_length_1273_cov_1.071550_2_plen_90_part_00